MMTWLKNLLTGQPHIAIGGVEPYMLRWYLIPRNRWLNVYLHKFVADDDDRAMHDHPWWFVSLMLWGSYLEHWSHQSGVQVLSRRDAPSVAFRRAAHRHRVELLRDQDGKPIPCWTLVITGRKVREWGFWCPKGFVRWQDFVAHDDAGRTGKGCGD